MSLELTAAAAESISTLWRAWEASPDDSEIEASFGSVQYTSFLDVIKHLRSIGLSEEPQETKLNIMTANGLRFTIVGEGPIRNYCKNDSLRGLPFMVMLKEKKAATAAGLAEVDMNEYGVRIKLRREILLDATNHRVAEALAQWSKLPKSFRYIKRFTFRSTTHQNIVFDASIVKESKKDTRGGYITSTTFVGAQVMKQPTHYEIEVEAKAGAAQKSLLVGVTTVLRGMQRTYVLTRKSVAATVRAQLVAQTGVRSGFPGAQPVTLTKENISLEPIADTPNLRYGDYNVTDKADGLRCALIVARDGRLYMVDRNLNVYGTGRRLGDAATAEWAGAVLDGEWVTRDAKDAPMSRYYAFDIFNGERGMDVTGRPFIVRNVGAAPVLSRNATLAAAIAAIEGAEFIVAGIPTHHKISFHMKTFRTAADPANNVGIFREAAAVLERLKTDAPYHTDGLIFTPNASPLPKRGAWGQQFKWKPAHMNSVDFLVSLRADDISVGLREDTNQIVRYKTLRLFVGSNVHPALEKPRETVLMEKPYPKASELGADYRPVEFAPQPPDPMASVCYVAINAGATDAAGAAPEAHVLESLDENIYCDESGDPIENRTIVEMVYNPAAPAGWRWTPMRVRWDKTERFARGSIEGTLNSADTANNVWASIHDPVTETMIRTGAATEETPVAGVAASAGAYYQRKAPQRDLYKIRGLVDFHNQYIKKMLITRALSNKGAALLDMSVGQGGDMNRWIAGEASFVLGCDIAESGLTDPRGGAYRRYLDQLIRARVALPTMIFIQADSSARYADGAAGMTPMDRVMLRSLWGEPEPTAPPAIQRLQGRAALGFDAAECMFSLHYFFKDRGTLDGFLGNLTETVKVGGLFVGCCFDGDAVASLLRDLPVGGVRRGNENGTDIWSIVKKYDDAGVVPPTDEGLGRAIDVNFISIGETYTEYLVSFPYFEERMNSIGFELLNREELDEMGLVNSTNMFGDSHKMAASLGLNYPMTPVIQTFSFLNRWFIFRRRRALGLTVAPVIVASAAPVAAPTAAPEIPAAEGEEAPAAPVIPDVIADMGEEGASAGAGAEAAEAPIVELEKADGPIFQFYHKSPAAKKAELKELGLTDATWRRYISPSHAFMYRDRVNPAIHYATLDAALGAAKYQTATNKPELGAQIFSETGNIHQKRMEEQTRLRGAGAGGRELSDEEIAEFDENEATGYRDAAKPTAIRKTGAKFDAVAWSAAEENVLVDFVRQRFESDVHFREILAALASKRARLVYVAKGVGDLAGVVKGETIEGLNLYGRALMRAVGFGVP
jgi:hypothetical protein